MAKGAGSSTAIDDGSGIKNYIGFLVVTIAVIAVLVALKITLEAFTPKDGVPVSTDVTAVLGIVTTAVSGMAGAFFGISLGQQGKAQADAGKDAAEKKAQVYAQFIDPSQQQAVATEMERIGL
jgi:hypothetical protein